MVADPTKSPVVWITLWSTRRISVVTIGAHSQTFCPAAQLLAGEFPPSRLVAAVPGVGLIVAAGYLRRWLKLSSVWWSILRSRVCSIAVFRMVQHALSGRFGSSSSVLLDVLLQICMTVYLRKQRRAEWVSLRVKWALRIRAGDHGQDIPGPLKTVRKSIRGVLLVARNVTWQIVSANAKKPRELPATGAILVHRTIASVMVSAERCARSPRITQGDGSSGGNGEHYGPERSDEEATSSVTAPGPKPKASRKVASKRKEKQPKKLRDEGELSKLPSMPLDILYEVSPRIDPVTDGGILDDGLQIFAFVHPMDLLRVSWTNKAFRNVLARESSRHAWIASFDNLPVSQRPPRCPEDLTEIAYANILYNPRCMVRVGVRLCLTLHG